MLRYLHCRASTTTAYLASCILTCWTALFDTAAPTACRRFIPLVDVVEVDLAHLLALFHLGLAVPLQRYQIKNLAWSLGPSRRANANKPAAGSRQTVSQAKTLFSLHAISSFRSCSSRRASVSTIPSLSASQNPLLAALSPSPSWGLYLRRLPTDWPSLAQHPPTTSLAGSD